MMYRTHFGTGVLFGLGATAGATVAGHPLPAEQAIALPVIVGYLSAIPDVDHHSAKIRFAVPPVRWLYVLVELLVRLVAGRDRARYWMGHRRITHSLTFAVALGALAAGGSWWAGGWWWLGPAVTLGCAAHLFGDCLTEQGCPLWLPWSGQHHRLLRLRTGGVREGMFNVVQTAGSAGLLWLLAG